MNIRFTKDFVNRAKLLRPAERQKLETKLALFAQNPLHPQLRNHRLKGKWGGYRSIDIGGDIRALYFESGDEAVFDQVGTHSQLYG